MPPPVQVEEMILQFVGDIDRLPELGSGKQALHLCLVLWLMGVCLTQRLPDKVIGTLRAKVVQLAVINDIETAN